MRSLSAAVLSGLLALLAGGAARAQDGVSVVATRHEDALEVVCRATLDAPLDIIWQTLTDYGRLPEFIPGMRRSRVLERHGPVAVVEQLGDAGFLFLTFPIEVTLVSTERPPYDLDVKLLKGNLKRLDGTYHVEPQKDGRLLLQWNGTVEALSMPPLLGELVMRSNIEDQFNGMVREILRREALRRGREGAPER